MISLKCKSCGGELEIVEESTVCECEFCGLKQTVPVMDDEKKIKLFERANRLRLNCEFDKAAGVYENIIEEFSEEAEGYWGLVLCKYGIEYVDDPAGDKVPTCHRSSFDSIMDDKDLELALEYADLVAKRVYREQAKQLEEIRKGIIEVVGKEEPYDIFICYKETDENGDRTVDSVLAQDMYDALTEKGYRVFFSRISLEDKLGVEYEPFIFAALNSAKVMLAVGTDYEYYDAVWVKNEWSRFLKLMAKDKTKHLIPCYKNLDAYDIPKEFAHLQAQDLGKVGATQDLIRGIEKLIGSKKEDKVEAGKAEAAPVVSQIASGGPNATALLKRGYLALEDEEWEKAQDFFDDVLNMDAECGAAYAGIYMAVNYCMDEEDLHEDIVEAQSLDSKEYMKMKRFAAADMLKKLNGWEQERANRIKKEKEERERKEAERRAAEARKRAEKAQKEAERKAEEERKKAEEARKEAERKAEEERKKLNFDRISKLIIDKEYNLTVDEQETLDRLFDDWVAVDKESRKAEDDYHSLPEHEKIKKLETLIAEKKEYLSTLGIFKQREKKTVQEEIAHLETEKYECAAIIKNSKDIWDEKARIEANLWAKYAKKQKEFEKQYIPLLVDELIANAADVDSIEDFVGECPFVLDIYPDIVKKYPDIVKQYPDISRAACGSILSVAKVGDEIVLGDGNSLWIVLEIKDGKVLLLRKYVIENRPYNTEREEITWEECTLRKWLNNDWINTSFNETEKTAIAETKVVNADNSKYGTEGGNDTIDKIFLLSIDEVNQYFATDEDRIALTAEGDIAWWWLRSPGRNSYWAAIVYRKDGSVNNKGYEVFIVHGAVRPALWIDISKL